MSSMTADRTSSPRKPSVSGHAAAEASLPRRAPVQQRSRERMDKIRRELEAELK